MSKTDGIDDRRGITGRHVLLMLVAFFGAILVANAIFITVALKSFPGESQKKSYVQGIRYNETLTERADQERLGWRAQITGVERKGGGAIIELHLSAADNKPLSGIAIDGELKRPTHHRDDRQIIFLSLGKGLYRAEIEALTPGVWDVDAVAHRADSVHFDIKARIIVP